MREMGGGAEAKFVRKRKRKTRSERNLLRNSQMEQDKQEEKCSRRKRDGMPPSPYYSLRSSKVSTAPLPPAPREIRMSRNITQGRLTMGLFPYSKSSDRITRGTIQDVANVKVKKKVEEGLRRIVNPSVRPLTAHIEDGDAGCRKMDSTVMTLSDTDRRDPVAFNVEEQNKVRHMPSSSTMPVASYSHNSSVQVQTASPVTSTSHTFDNNTTAKACPKSNRSTVSSTTAKSDCELDKVLPVNEIADKILQNLKPKFNKLFPTRDLDSELNAGLKKLLKQSSRKVSLPNHTPVMPGTTGQGNSLRERLHVPDQSTTATYSTQAFTVFQPFDNGETGSPRFQSVCMGDTGDESETAIAAQNLLSDNGFLTNDKPSLTSLSSLPPLQHFITSNPCHQEDLSRPVRFIIPSNYSDGNNDVVKDHFADNVNMVIESNKPTSHHYHHSHPFDQYVSYSPNKTYQRRGGHHHQDGVGTHSTNPSLGFILPSAFGDSCNDAGHDPDKPIIINIHDKDGEDSDNDEDSRYALAKYNSFMASARSLKAKLKRQNEQKHILCQDLPHQCVVPGRGGSCVYHTTSPVTKCYLKNAVDRFKFPDDNSSKYSVAKDLSVFGIRKSHTSSGSHTIQGGSQHNNNNNHHHNHHYHLRSRTHLPIIPDCFSSKGEESGALSGSSNLAQSRHRLKTALDSILMDPPGGKPFKSSLLYCNEESMDWQDVDILTDIYPHGNDALHHPQPDQYDIHRQPLDQLRVHQSDMQHQARSFLNHLDQDVIGGGLGNGQQPHHHHQPSSSPPPPPTFHQRHLHSLSSSSCPSQAWL